MDSGHAPEALRDAMRALSSATGRWPSGLPEFRRAAMEMDLRRKPYWSTEVEAFARLFEVWACDSLAALGRVNEFLVHGVGSPDSPSSWPGGIDSYPSGAERARAVAAMGAFLAAAVLFIAPAPPS